MYTCIQPYIHIHPIHPDIQITIQTLQTLFRNRFQSHSMPICLSVGGKDCFTSSRGGGALYPCTFVCTVLSFMNGWREGWIVGSMDVSVDVCLYLSGGRYSSPLPPIGMRTKPKSSNAALTRTGVHAHSTHSYIHDMTDITVVKVFSLRFPCNRGFSHIIYSRLQ